MAEKRRVVGSPVPRPPPGPANESEFLAQSGVRDMMRDAVMKVLEARPEDPVVFLAEYFEKLGHSSEERAAAGAAEAQGPFMHGQQRICRALWYLKLAHHSQRTAFTNNLNVAYDCLSAEGRKKKPGLNGKIYSEVLGRICQDGGLPSEITSLLLKKIQCQDHEAVPFDVFRYGVLTCFVLLEFMSKAESLFGIFNESSQAGQRLCQAVLNTLEEALVASDLCVPASYLEAGSKLGPDCLAVAMNKAFLDRNPKDCMNRVEFLKEASALFLEKVKPIQ
ncbi:tubulin polyglutamylase complex subunit 1 [Bombina bombina]|uniref:tubulin polyglutamylase complex subunit 1 n=1 Tax=Bombina bombina TaxID=8345 RepID=UPI00235A7239|nr:tubulin polyglutamylase complex subunit 1 [Bombina bombina]